MKKFSLCIGVVMVLFLVICVYTAQAQDYNYAALNALNGKWLKMSGTAKGVTYSEEFVEAAPVGNFTFNFKDQYACIQYNPANSGCYLFVYDKTGKEIGYAFLYYYGGTAAQWTGELSYFVAVGTYDDYATDGVNLNAYSGVSAKIKDDTSKGSIKGVGGYGYTWYMNTATDYSDMSVKINAMIVAADKLPFTGTACAYVEETP
jgi:hypothetical protein